MRYVKHDNPLQYTHPKLGALGPIEVEVPQFESHEEFVTAAGGAQEALDWINGKVASAAKVNGNVVFRNAAETDSKEDVYSKARAAIRGYTPRGGAKVGTGVRSQANDLQDLLKRKAAGEEITAEDWAKLQSKYGI